MSTDNLAVRPVRPDDVPAVQQLIDAVYREYDTQLNALHEDTYLIAPGPYFRIRGGEFWVVEKDGDILATVAVKLRPDDAAELKTLYVHPSLRRQGWGQKLSALVLDYAHARGKQRVILWSDTRFIDAHRLYERLGFTRTGAIRDLQDSNNSIEYEFEIKLT